MQFFSLFTAVTILLPSLILANPIALPQPETSDIFARSTTPYNDGSLSGSTQHSNQEHRIWARTFTAADLASATAHYKAAQASYSGLNAKYKAETDWARKAEIANQFVHGLNVEIEGRELANTICVELQKPLLEQQGHIQQVAEKQSCLARWEKKKTDAETHVANTSDAQC